MDLTLGGSVVTTNSVVLSSVCFLVVCRASVLLVGVVKAMVVVIGCLLTVVISRVVVLASVGRVVISIGSSFPDVGPWVGLDGTRGVGVTALVCWIWEEDVVENVVYRMVTSVDDPGAELLVVLLSLEEEVVGRGEAVVVVIEVVVVVAMVLVVGVELTVAFKVFCSVETSLLKEKKNSQLKRTESLIRHKCH